MTPKLRTLFVAALRRHPELRLALAGRLKDHTHNTPTEQPAQERRRAA